jgi:uncharacterized phage-associated protein
MTYDGRAVANFVLDRCSTSNRQVSNLALQKIVFFCHVWSLVELQRPLIKHKFEAWQLGPVLPYLYRDFKAYDSSPIGSRAKGLDPNSGQARIVPYAFDKQTAELLEHVIDFYSRVQASDLVDMTHIPGGPWHKVWHHSGTTNPGMRIDDEEIATFYSKVRRPFLVQ